MATPFGTPTIRPERVPPKEASILGVGLCLVGFGLCLWGLVPLLARALEDRGSFDEKSAVVRQGLRVSITSLEAQGKALEITYSFRYLLDPQGERLTTWLPRGPSSFIYVTFWDATGRNIAEVPVEISHRSEIIQRTVHAEFHTFRVSLPAVAHSISIQYGTGWLSTRRVRIP